MKDTIKFGDKDYSLVPGRLLKFREANPRGQIKTTPKFNEDGSLEFQAYILKDKADETSADATGSAYYTAKEMTKAKSYEKLETISVGRALSLLGYLNDGQIASSEEMEEFEDYKHNQLFESIETAVNTILAIETLNELKTYFQSLPPKVATAQEVYEAKEKRKVELS